MVGLVFEDPQIANLAGDVVDVGRPILPFDADEDQEAVADLSDGARIDSNGCG